MVTNSGPTQKNVSQDDGMVMNLVMGREDERDPAGFSARAEFVEPPPMSVNLFRVSSSKFLPARWIMPKPIAQHGTGRDALVPLIDSCACFVDPSWPQAVNQYPGPVARRRRIIGAF